MSSDGLTAIFDVDGTLVDSTYHHATCWGKAFSACGVPIPMWRLHRAIGMGGDRLIREVGGNQVEEELGDELRALWRDAYQETIDSVIALPGAKALLESLRNKHVNVSIASSGNGDDTMRALEIAGVGDLVKSVTTGDDVDRSKPDPQVVAEAWKRTGQGSAVVVGDSIYDVRAANQLGLPCIGVRTGGFGVAELQDEGAALVVDDLSALIDRDLSTLTH